MVISGLKTQEMFLVYFSSQLSEILLIILQLISWCWPLPFRKMNIFRQDKTSLVCVFQHDWHSA